MSSRHQQPQQYKQSSRKGKKAWRKNVDVTEVEGGLEQLREEILSGGPIAERPSEDIFTVDTQGSESVRSKHKRELKPLKVDQILARRSKVPIVDGRKRPIRLADLSGEPSAKRKKGWVSRAKLQALKENLNDTNNLSDRRLAHPEEAALDLWENEIVEVDRMSHLEKAKPIVAPVTLQHAPIAMTAHGRPVKAVQIPAAGASYNPDFADWDELLNKEGQKQVEIEQKRLAAEQVEAERAARIAAIADAPEEATEDEESVGEDVESDYDKPEWLSKKRPKRKSQAQANRQQRRKQSESLALHEAKIAGKKQQAQQIQQLSRNSQLETVGDDERQLAEELAATIEEEQDDSVLRRKRLRNISIPEKVLEVVLPDELQDSLRRLKPEGRLLDDRFRHLMVNGKIEPRNRVLKTTRKKVKYTEKWSHKDFSVEV